MIFLDVFTKERFHSILKDFVIKLKDVCGKAYTVEYSTGYRGASDGTDDCISALEKVSKTSLDEIKVFLEDVESILIKECRGSKANEYVDLLDGLIPCQSKIRKNDYYNRLHTIRLFISFLALNKVVKLNCMIGSHPKSMNAAIRIGSTELKSFLPPLANDLWIGATEKRFEQLKDQIQTPHIAKNYLEYIKNNSFSVDKLSQAFKRFADIIVANGITELDEISFDVLMAYHEDLMIYHNSSPASYNLEPALTFLTCEDPERDKSFYDEFILKRASSRRGEPTDNHNVLVYLGSSKKAVQLIGSGVEGVNTVTVQSRDRKSVIDYGYWAGLAGTDEQFSPDNLGQKNLWIAAQHDYIRHTSNETSTIKQKKARLSILNKYLFSYLPAYFDSGLSGGFNYPNHPEEFLSCLYVQRSNLFELENVVKFTDGFQYPVTLQQFVYDMTSAAQFENTKNNNSGRDALLIISNFFDYLTNLDSKQIESFRNPLDGKVKPRVGNKYIKNTKYVFGLDYWLGLRSFCSAVTDQMLDEALESIETGENSKDYIFVDKDINVDGTMPMFIGKVNLEPFAKIQLIKHAKVYGLKGSKDQNLYINNHISWSLMTLLLHSGLRRSNALWLDDQECFILASNTEKDFQPLLVTTDKAKSQSFQVVVSSSTMNMLKKVYEVKKVAMESNPDIAGEVPYNGHKESKWGDVSPLFRLKPSHSDAAYPNYCSEIINEYESFLRRNGVDFEPTTLFVPKLYYSVDEFIHLCNIGDFDSKNSEVSIDYSDCHAAVKCVPIARKTQVTPHSLRTMTVSIFAPIVGANVVGNLLTGQCESTVGYYTKALPDSASRDFITQVVALLGTDTEAFNNLVTVRDSEINQESFEGELKICPSSTINKYNAQSINFEITGETSGHVNGLNALRNVDVNKIAYYRTHICPTGGICPKEIVDGLGEKKCFACPLAVTTNNHLSPISATIRTLCDGIRTLNTQLDTFDMLETERTELSKRKMDFIVEASYWEARRAVIEDSNENGIYYVSDEGLQLIHSIKPQNATEQEKLLLRLKETEGVPKLHSEKLKLQSARLRRKIELQAKVRSSEDIEDLSDMEYLAMVLNMKADLQGFTESEKMALLGIEV